MGDMQLISFLKTTSGNAKLIPYTVLSKKEITSIHYFESNCRYRHFNLRLVDVHFIHFVSIFYFTF
jgi:hypothetical protein